jgi:hypothetical protein
MGGNCDQSLSSIMTMMVYYYIGGIHTCFDNTDSCLVWFELPHDHYLGRANWGVFFNPIHWGCIYLFAHKSSSVVANDFVFLS